MSSKEFEVELMEIKRRRAKEKDADPDMSLTWADQILVDPRTTWVTLDKLARREVVTDLALKAKRWMARSILGRTDEYTPGNLTRGYE